MNPQRATLRWTFWDNEAPPVKDNLLWNIVICNFRRLTKIGTTIDDNIGI